MLDSLAFLFSVSILGSFAFWLIAYFLYQMIAHYLRGPSQQLQSLDHSVLNQPEEKHQETSPTKAA